jgi:hypothetical protein
MNILCDANDMLLIERIHALSQMHIKQYDIKDYTYDEIFEAISILELERMEKEKEFDSLIDFNDEIVSIEDVGELDVVDITVDGDSLFYCNNVLTKNSYGTLFTLDVLIGIITTEEFDAQNKILYKQLKNRYADKNKMNKFFLGVNKAKMTLYSQMQRGISPDNRQEKQEDEQNAMMFKGKKNKFDNFNF